MSSRLQTAAEQNVSTNVPYKITVVIVPSPVEPLSNQGASKRKFFTAVGVYRTEFLSYAIIRQGCRFGSDREAKAIPGGQYACASIINTAWPKEVEQSKPDERQEAVEITV